MKNLVSLLILFFWATSFIKAQSNEWIHVKADKCNFEVIFPDQPVIKIDSMLAESKYIYSYDYSASSSDYVAYSVTCSDFPVASLLKSKEEIISALKQSATAMYAEKPMMLEEVNLDEYTGIFFVHKRGDIISYHNAYLVKNKLYQLYVAGINKDAEHEASLFFDSFSVQ